MTGEWKKYIAFTLTIIFVTASIAVLSIYSPVSSTPSITSSNSTVTLSQSQGTSTTTSISTVRSTETTTVTIMLTSTTAVVLNSTSGQLGPWNSTTPFPGYYPPSSCVTANDFVYCVGGNANATFFAPISAGGIGHWARSTDYPVPVVGDKCIVSSGHIYCVGGESTAPAAQANDPFGRIADVYYATVSSSGIGKWTKTTSFPYVIPSPRCMLASSQIYCVVASFDGRGFTNPARTFFATLSSDGVGNWTQGAGPPSMPAGCSEVGGDAYCYGGAPCSLNPPPSDCFSPSFSAALSPNGVASWNSTTQLPTAVYAVYGAAESFVYYFSTPIFFAHVSGNSIGPWETTTNFPDGFSPGACASSGAQIYCIGGGRDGAYFALVGAKNPGALQLQNPPPFPRANYIVKPQTGCGLTVGETCFGRNIDDAVVFDCADSAARPSGCERTVVNPSNPMLNYNITIWYPAFNPPLSNANCEILPEFGYNSPAKAWCISISQTSFIVAEPINIQSPQH